MEALEKELLLDLTKKLGEFTGKIGGIEESLRENKEVHDTLFRRIDEERKERVEVQKGLTDSISQARGGMKVAGAALGFVGTVFIGVSGYAAITLSDLKTQSNVNAANIETTSEIVKEIRITGAPEGYLELQKSVEQLVKDMAELKNKKQQPIVVNPKVEVKMPPQAPATIIVPKDDKRSFFGGKR